jgi:hypothetical protein
MERKFKKFVIKSGIFRILYVFLANFSQKYFILCKKNATMDQQLQNLAKFSKNLQFSTKNEARQAMHYGPKTSKFDKKIKNP